MYNIRKAGAKGLGIFASRHIPRGTRILEESPLFTVQSERHAYAAIKSLPEHDKHWIEKLSTNSQKGSSLLEKLSALSPLLRDGNFPTTAALSEYSNHLNIFRNNNFDIGGGIQAMFREISRINHSCRPNSQGNFNKAIGKFTIHATRPVEQDEEITISYLVERGAVRESRQTRLRQGYGFDCDCASCDSASTMGQESEQRRGQMGEKLQKHAELAALSGRSGETADLQMLMDMIGIFELEGLAGRELSTMYLAAAEKYSTLGRGGDARRCAELGLEAEKVCVGIDNPLYDESVARMRHIIGAVTGVAMPQLAK